MIVTDLRQDYGPLIAQVFPQAVHHECIFHALQNAQKHIKEAYGLDYQTAHPEAVHLKGLIYAIFDVSRPRPRPKTLRRRAGAPSSLCPCAAGSSDHL